MSTMAETNPPEAANGQDEGNDEAPGNTRTKIEISAILYVMESFKATAIPVGITMILSALASNFILSESSAKAAEQRITSSYSAIAVDEDASSSTQLGVGLLNGIIIISVITAMTFLVVILYKYKCICILKGYMTFAIMFLLGYFGSQMFLGAINRYELWVTYISFALFLWNFTAVGVYSIFYGKGVPVYLGQGYLIVVSVILAWELSHFSEVTAWILLVLLALYDLFAVLAPCGPLKALVKLMSQEGAAELPALMYEAQLPAGARRQSPSAQPQQQQQQQQQQQTTQPPLPTQEREQDRENSNSTNTNNAHGTENNNPQNSESTPSHPMTDSPSEEKKDDDTVTNGSHANVAIPGASQHGVEEATNVLIVPAEDAEERTTTTEPAHAVISSTASAEVVHGSADDELEMVSRPTGIIPMAIAKRYKVPLADGEAATRAMMESQTLSPAELHSLVDVYFPHNGGRIERVPDPEPGPEQAETYTGNSLFRRRRGQRRETSRDQRTKYNVIDREGAIKRTIFVGDDGKLYRVLDEEERQQREQEEERKIPTSIRLGLGDFIFYSVLVSKASLFSFTTFASCVLGILAGLLLTLVLLAIRGKALPALPISIFFGVVFYFPTRFVLRPWIEGVFIEDLYV